MGRQDTNKTLTNIFDFATKKLDYKNTNVPQSQIPLMNETDPAFLASIPAQYLPLLGL
jgi:acid phosphatase